MAIYEICSLVSDGLSQVVNGICWCSIVQQSSSFSNHDAGRGENFFRNADGYIGRNDWHIAAQCDLPVFSSFGEEFLGWRGFILPKLPTHSALAKVEYPRWWAWWGLWHIPTRLLQCDSME